MAYAPNYYNYQVGVIFGIMLGGMLLLAAVLGGIDSPIGAVVGGLLLGVGLNLIGAYVDFVGADHPLRVEASRKEFGHQAFEIVKRTTLHPAAAARVNDQIW